MIFAMTSSFQNFYVYVLVQIKAKRTSARKVQPLKNSRKNDKTLSVLVMRQARFHILHANWVLMLLMTNCEVGN